MGFAHLLVGRLPRHIRGRSRRGRRGFVAGVTSRAGTLLDFMLGMERDPYGIPYHLAPQAAAMPLISDIRKLALRTIWRSCAARLKISSLGLIHCVTSRVSATYLPPDQLLPGLGIHVNHRVTPE